MGAFGGARREVCPGLGAGEPALPTLPGQAMGSAPSSSGAEQHLTHLGRGCLCVELFLHQQDFVWAGFDMFFVALGAVMAFGWRSVVWCVHYLLQSLEDPLGFQGIKTVWFCLSFSKIPNFSSPQIQENCP